MSYYSANPARDAERYEDDMERAAAKADAERKERISEISAQFVDASEWGADEPVGKGWKMADAIREITASNPELIEEFFYHCAREKDDPVMRAMVQKVADEWALLLEYDFKKPE